MVNGWSILHPLELINNNRIILHIDLDSFFASAEQQANPSLRGKPVGIIKAQGRTCIIASSIEAKKRGVQTGARVKEAKKICSDIILVPADFNKYQDISRRFINICSKYSPKVEVFSLDECFVDVTETEKFWGHVFNIAVEIKKQLREEVGEVVTCSIGISHNRLLAKLASTHGKPNGFFWITNDNAQSVLDKSKLTDVCGLGFGLYRRLSILRVKNFSELRNLSPSYLYKHFGPFWSVHLYNLARGIDKTAVVSYKTIPDAKSVGRTYTAHKLLYKKLDVFKIARNLCEEVTFKARQMGLNGRYVGFALRSSQNSFYGYKTLKNDLDDGQLLFEICIKIAKNRDLRKGVIFCGVTLGMLTCKKFSSLPLFSEEKHKQRINSTVDKINKRFGNYTIFPGQLLGMPIIMPEVTGFFGDKKYQLDYQFKV